MIRGKHDIRMGFGFRAKQMNVATDAFQDGFFVMVPIGLYSLDAAADTLLGQTVVGRHDQTFPGRHHWPPLEDVPSVYSG